MTSAAYVSPMAARLLICRGVGLEILRRKDFYVLLMLTMVYVAGMIVAALVGVKDHATVLFLLNLSVTLALFAAHLLTMLTAARQIPDEMENRTLYPLLAKPVSRLDYLLGKWMACSAAGIVAFVVLLTLSCLPWGLFGSLPVLHYGCFAQAFVLAMFTIPLMAALALYGSLVMPKPVSICILTILFLGGDSLTNIVRSRVAGSGFDGIVHWLLLYLPNFSQFNLFIRFTDGVAGVSAAEFLSLVGVASLFNAAALAAACLTFSRRPL